MGALPLKRPVGELYANERAEEGIRRREHIGRSVQNTARSDEGLAPTGRREEAGSGRKSSPWGGRPTLRVPRRAAGWGAAAWREPRRCAAWTSEGAGDSDGDRAAPSTTLASGARVSGLPSGLAPSAPDTQAFGQR